MIKSVLISLFLVTLFLAGGCRSREPIDLYKPNDIEVWRDTRPRPSPSQAPETEGRAIVRTSMGEFILEFYESEAPISTENFRRYVEDGFYNGTIFHRVIPGFMIQGGGFDEAMVPKPTRDPIQNEAGNGLRNLRGTVAMARTQQLDGATAQFFVNVADNGFLNGDGVTDGYAVFGRVVEGMDVVDRIAFVDRGRVGGHDDVPLEPVLIEEIRMVSVP